MTDILALAVTIWGVAMAISPLLQVRRMRATGSSADLSVGYLLVLQVGFVLWLSYGIALGNPALIISNCAALACGLLTIAVARRLRAGPTRAQTASITSGSPEASPSSRGDVK